MAGVIDPERRSVSSSGHEHLEKQGKLGFVERKFMGMRVDDGTRTIYRLKPRGLRPGISEQVRSFFRRIF